MTNRGVATSRIAHAFAACLALGYLFTLTAASAHAQDPAAPPAEPAPMAEAAPPPVRSDQVQPKPADKSRLIWFIESNGLIGLGLLVLSIYFVATTSQLFLSMRQQIATPPDLVADLTELLQKREFKEIYSVVKEDQSFFSRLLATGIAELPNGLAEARDAMERVGEAVTVEMEKRISMLAVLGTLGPMIGLLGTLMGMIESFSTIAMHDTQLKANEVASGISKALLLTLEGVGLSVPAIFFYAVFRNRVSAISVTTQLQADEFLRHFAHAAAKSASPAGSKSTAAQTASAEAANTAKP